jgi:ABC-type multidrug transport system ATPase subunit
MEQIRNHARDNNATVIIIAHRYATVEDVDEILVLDRGKPCVRDIYLREGYLRSVPFASQQKELTTSLHDTPYPQVWLLSVERTRASQTRRTVLSDNYWRARSEKRRPMPLMGAFRRVA